jgi:hypothetical protein
MKPLFLALLLCLGNYAFAQNYELTYDSTSNSYYQVIEMENGDDYSLNKRRITDTAELINIAADYIIQSEKRVFILENEISSINLTDRYNRMNEIFDNVGNTSYSRITERRFGGLFENGLTFTKISNAQDVTRLTMEVNYTDRGYLNVSSVDTEDPILFNFFLPIQEKIYVKDNSSVFFQDVVTFRYAGTMKSDETGGIIAIYRYISGESVYFISVVIQE